MKHCYSSIWSVMESMKNQDRFKKLSIGVWHDGWGRFQSCCAGLPVHSQLRQLFSVNSALHFCDNVRTSFLQLRGRWLAISAQTFAVKPLRHSEELVVKRVSRQQSSRAARSIVGNRASRRSESAWAAASAHMDSHMHFVIIISSVYPQLDANNRTSFKSICECIW